MGKGVKVGLADQDGILGVDFLNGGSINWRFEVVQDLGGGSCVTNLYKRGYPVNYVMTLSGHRSMQAFQRYMRASSKEVMADFVHLLKKDKALPCASGTCSPAVIENP